MLILREEKIIDNDNIIGSNIRRIRLEKGIGQTELVKQLQLMDVDITRETLVKIESGKQHIKLEQLKYIKKLLNISYELLIEEK
ncbi:helix-turn-helix domain-containing protein [Vagococcus carniphilus]|uniref:helix-turn-helix domain-containing protein n=1 Tax=Vagococcus carniphilus TaxID=218144 RepID=UPI003BA8C534